MSTKGFFRIDRRTWAKVCELGMNPAVAYLVLACGTGKDHRGTSWSVQAAVKKYTAIAVFAALLQNLALLNSNALPTAA